VIAVPVNWHFNKEAVVVVVEPLVVELYFIWIAVTICVIVSAKLARTVVSLLSDLIH